MDTNEEIELKPGTVVFLGILEKPEQLVPDANGCYHYTSMFEIKGGGIADVTVTESGPLTPAESHI